MREPPVVSGGTIVIRDLETEVEMRAVEELQKEIWGLPDLDVVPFSHLIAVRAAGGVLIGAFDSEELVGFCYGFPSYEYGQMTHHSHMLAVKPRCRNLHLGHKLKLAQRDRVLAQGVSLITWTFDPLQSLNAYFNFSRLGVISDRYYINFYGEEASSFLHRNGTDRIWVRWPLTEDRVVKKLDGERLQEIFQYQIPLVQISREDTPMRNESAASFSAENVLIEIPGDIISLQQRKGNLALQWRESTRWAFNEALAAGYLIVDFHRRNRGSQKFGSYLLTRDKRFSES